MNYKKLIPVLGILTLLPSITLAAFNTVTMSDTTVSIALPGNGLSYAIDSATKVETFSVNTDTIDFTLLGGSYIKLSSADGSKFRTSGDTACITLQSTCNATTGSTITIQCTNSDAGHVLTVTPFDNCAPTPPAPSGGGSYSSGGGGGGGGGGSYTPSTPSPVVPAPTPVVVPPVTGSTVPRVLTVVNGNGSASTPVKTSAVKYQFARNLGRGSSVKEVTELQNKLKALGFFPAATKANGVYGPGTLAAVKKFQTVNKIKPANGLFGTATRSLLNKK